MQKILITTECVADLPPELVEEYNIGIIYYTIKTDKGEFRDTDEITAMNVMEYMLGGEKKALSIIPSARDYADFFQKNLEEYDEIIHISISAGVSEAYENAKAAKRVVDVNDSRIQIINSRHLSSGQGLIVIEAARLNKEGKTSKEIVEYVNALIPKVSTSFLAFNADYLYYNDKVSKHVRDICQIMKLHPVLAMSNGKLKLKRVYIGNFNRAARKYVRKLLGSGRKINKRVAFITHAGGSLVGLQKVNNDVQKVVGFDTIYEQQASATISCNCGPSTFGLIFIKK